MDKKTVYALQDDAAKMIQDTIFWYEDRIETLKSLAESKNLIVLASEDGENVKFDEEQSVIFKAALQTAITLMGEFPLALDQPLASINVNKLGNE